MSQKFYSEVTLETLNNATTDTDRFLVGDSGTIKYRTGSQLLSDLGVSGLYVPYTGATGNVDLGTHTLSSYNLIVNHTSGSGVAASITKGGSGEALTINKTSGSGNAMSVTGGLTSLVNLTLSSIANATIDTDRFIVSDGGAIKYRTGAEVLSDIGGQAALTNPITGTGTTNYVSKFTGATTLGDSQIFDNGTNVGIGTTTPFGKLEIRGIESNTKDLLLNLSKYAYGATQFYQNYSNTFYTAGKSLEIEVEALPLLQLAVNNAGSVGKVIFPNGNVGIGTTSPGAKLDISQSLSGEGLRVDGAGGGFALVVEGGSSYSTRIRLASIGNNYGGNTPPNNGLIVEGNVGIGIASPTYKFEVSDGTRTGVINPNSSLDGIYMGVTQAKPLIFGTADTERMRITSSGNVGIGTTSPNNLLTLNSSGAAGNSTALGLYNTFDTAANRNWVIGLNVIQYGDFAIRTSSTQNGTPETTRFLIANNGNVGIGTTSPGEKLTILSSTINTNTVLIQNTSGTGVNYGLEIKAGTNSVDHALQVLNSSGGSLLRVRGDGNVGIGTTSPTAKLVVSNGGVAIQGDSTPPSSGYGLEIFNSATTSYIGSYNRTTSAYRNAFLFANDTIFENGGSERVRITSNGNVGIGTTSPSAKLDVTDTSAGNIVNNITVQNASNTAGTEAGVFFAPTTATGNIRGARITGIQEDGNNTIGLKFYTALGATPTEKMRITSGGNVGIGTTSPTLGKLVSKDSGYQFIAEPTDTATYGYLGIGQFTNGAFIGTTAGSNSASDILRLGTSGTERMRITSSGNVGIGLTSPNPSALLHLKSTTQGFLPPVMRTGERNGISSPAIGLMIFNEEDDAVQVYTGGGWKTLAWL